MYCTVIMKISKISVFCKTSEFNLTIKPHHWYMYNAKDGASDLGSSLHISSMKECHDRQQGILSGQVENQVVVNLALAWARGCRATSV